MQLLYYKFTLFTTCSLMLLVDTFFNFNRILIASSAKILRSNASPTMVFFSDVWVDYALSISNSPPSTYVPSGIIKCCFHFMYWNSNRTQTNLSLFHYISTVYLINIKTFFNHDFFTSRTLIIRNLIPHQT